MLDFSHILTNPNYDVQIFQGNGITTLLNWQQWTKPRGVTMTFMIGVGGGSSGGVGLNSAATSGGGAGGGSGAQSTLLIPSMFLPDRLFIQAGSGGRQPAALVSAAVGVAGTISYVSIEPTTTLAAATILLLATGGLVTGTAAAATTGGVAGAVATLPTIAGMPLAGRGFYTFLAGQAGSAGGASTTAGVALTPPVTGLMVSGGAGGGGTGGATPFAGGAFTQPTSTLGNYFPPIPGGNASAAAVPAGDGSGGLVIPNFIMNYGGAGGGAANATAGGNAGNGGNGAPGCGGGGGGGATLTNTTLGRPGNGGDGFVIIISW